MSRRPDTMWAQLGPGVLSTSLGIAVQVSDLDGPTVEIAAWSAVGLGIVMIAAGSRRLRVAQRTQPADRDRRRSVARKLDRLGGEILQFSRERAYQAPRVSPTGGLIQRHPLKASRERQAQLAIARAYAEDTLHIFDESFGLSLRDLIPVLIDSKSIGANEARDLVAPRDVADIEAVGRRLIELSRPLARSSTKAA